jgi:hypothetical protein
MTTSRLSIDMDLLGRSSANSMQKKELVHLISRESVVQLLTIQQIQHHLTTTKNLLGTEHNNSNQQQRRRSDCLKKRMFVLVSIEDPIKVNPEQFDEDLTEVHMKMWMICPEFSPR